MRKFIFKILILIALVTMVDIIGGMFFRYWFERIESGEIAKEQYIAHHAKEDLLVFGSSRAEFHYNPLILSDSLGLTAYNCGASGYGIILAYARLRQITQRHMPKVIVLDVSRDFDIVKSDNTKTIGAIKPIFDDEGMDSVVYSIDATEKYKMISQLYRYNSNLHHQPMALFKASKGERNPDVNHGFVPQKGVFDNMKVSRQGFGFLDIHEVDSLKMTYVEKFINIAKGARLFFVVSPVWYGLDTLEIKPIRDVCQRHGIPFVDFSNNSKYVHNDSLFKDGKHLNSKGADIFSADLAHLLHQALVN